ncbi:MAG: hypothetical protein ACMUEM_06135 [Flavobacteriales bacterium AspAUS03]
MLLEWFAWINSIGTSDRIKVQEVLPIELPLMDWTTNTEGVQKINITRINVVLVDDS